LQVKGVHTKLILLPGVHSEVLAEFRTVLSFAFQTSTVVQHQPKPLGAAHDTNHNPQT